MSAKLAAARAISIRSVIGFSRRRRQRGRRDARDVTERIKDRESAAAADIRIA
jgi:hypothetical protein